MNSFSVACRHTWSSTVATCAREYGCRIAIPHVRLQGSTASVADARCWHAIVDASYAVVGDSCGGRPHAGVRCWLPHGFAIRGCSSIADTSTAERRSASRVRSGDGADTGKRERSPQYFPGVPRNPQRHGTIADTATNCAIVDTAANRTIADTAAVGRPQGLAGGCWIGWSAAGLPLY